MADTQPRLIQGRLARSASWAEQSDFGSANALANGAIDTLFSLDGPVGFELVDDSEDIINCTGEELIDVFTRSQSIRLTVPVIPDASDIHGACGFFFGNVSGADALLLGAGEFQGPITSMIFGFDDPVGVVVKLFDLTGDELTISCAAMERPKMQMTFRGNAVSIDASAYTFPACSDPSIIRLEDGDFLLDAVSRLEEITNLEFTFSNGLDPKDFHTAASPTVIKRTQRADKRTYLLKYSLFGQPYNDDYNDAVAKTKLGWTWQLGPSNDGVSIIAASGITGQAAAPGGSGPFNRSTLNLQNRPIKISGNANTPVKATRLT